MLFLSFEPDIIIKMSGQSYTLQNSIRFGVTSIVIDPLCQTDVMLLHKLVLKVRQTVFIIVIYLYFLFHCIASTVFNIRRQHSWILK